MFLSQRKNWFGPHKILTTTFIFRELEELEAIREAEETALRQAEIAAEEAAAEAAAEAAGDILGDDLSLGSASDEHQTTPSTRSLSREKAEDQSGNSSQTSFKNPTYPLAATMQPTSTRNGMTDSAVMRQVSLCNFLRVQGPRFVRVLIVTASPHC